MPRHDYRWLIVFAANLVLWVLVGLANHYLTAFSIPFFSDFATMHLYVGGLFVTYAALRLDALHGFTATILTALLIDSAEPVPFGTSLVLFGLVHAFLLYGRLRFPREELVFGTVVALLSNLFLFLVLSFLLIGDNPRPADAWLRLFVDLLASQLVIALITPWFLSLQARAHALARIHPETGRRVLT